MSGSQPQRTEGSRSARFSPLRRFRDHRWLLAAMLLAAMFEAIVIARSPLISRDGVKFIQLARQLPSGVSETLRTHDQHPGYPAMILAVRQLLPADDPGDATARWIQAARLSAALCGVLIVAVIWAIARVLFRDPVPDVAAIVAATLPVLRQNAADALSDSPHLLLWLTACLLACVAVRRWQVSWFAAAGLLSGLAYWVRPEGLSVALVLCAAAPLVAWWTRSASLPRLALCVTATAVVAVATIAPYSLLSSKLLTSKQDPMAKAEPVLPYVVRKAQADANSGAALEASTTETTARPTPHVAMLAVVMRTLGESVMELAAELMKALHYVYVPIFLFGCVFVVRREPPLAPITMINLLGLSHAALLLYVYFMSGYISHRHVLPIIALAIPACAVGLTHLGVWLADRLSVTPRRGVVIAALICVAIVTPRALRQLNYSYSHLLEAVRWIDAHTPPGAVVASNTSLVPFYAGRSGMHLNQSAPTVEEAIRADAENRCDYVVLDELTRDFNPSWRNQLDARFTLVKEFAPPRGAGHQTRMTIYEALPPAPKTSKVPLGSTVSKLDNTVSKDDAVDGTPTAHSAVRRLPLTDASVQAVSASL
jgi:hypothetical protein